MSTTLAVTIGAFSSAGVKDANQDFHGALVPDGSLLATKGVALALADGISTSALGATAAETAVKSFLTDYFATSEAWSPRTSGQRVIAATNSWMHAQNLRGPVSRLSDEEREQGMVCTFDALILRSRSAHLFHVGDGQIARITGGRLEVLTEPHRVSLGGGESYLSRALGIDRNVEIETRSLPVSQGDVFYLTSDGVHEVLPASAFIEAAALADPDAAARLLVDAALASGSADNVTVQVVRIDSLPKGELADLAASDGELLPAPLLSAGQEFEGYRIVRTLHAGHRSHVYLARDVRSGGRVVLKIPSTESAADPEAVRSLLLEEWIARRVSHPHLLGAPATQGARRHAYAVTDYLEGESLEHWAHKGDLLDPVEVRSIIRQVAAGLQALHRREILHRDLRPANVMLDGEGTARIIDFGSAQVAGLDEIAAPHGAAMFAGTLQFTAPEIWLGHPATRQSDLWSLGAITYYLLTRQLPYGAHLSAARTRAAQRKLRYVPATEYNPEVPDWMDAAIAHAVALDPARRYAEFSEFTYDLSHPNPALDQVAPRTFLERRPERIWQAISALLAAALIAALATRENAGRLPAANLSSIEAKETQR